MVRRPMSWSEAPTELVPQPGKRKSPVRSVVLPMMTLFSKVPSATTEPPSVLSSASASELSLGSSELSSGVPSSEVGWLDAPLPSAGGVSPLPQAARPKAMAEASRSASNFFLFTIFSSYLFFRYLPVSLGYLYTEKHNRIPVSFSINYTHIPQNARRVGGETASGGFPSRSQQCRFLSNSYFFPPAESGLFLVHLL